MKKHMRIECKQKEQEYLNITAETTTTETRFSIKPVSNGSVVRTMRNLIIN